MNASSDRPRRAHRPGRLGSWMLLLSGTIWAGAALPAEELPRSPACRTAVQALDDAETLIAASAAASDATASDRHEHRTVATRLQPLRERVAKACLGGMTTSPPPSQHTWVAPTPTRPIPAELRALVPARPLASAPPMRVEKPLTLNTCNAATCIASDGSTLTRVGPGLVGPRGTCTLQGAFVHCP